VEPVTDQAAENEIDRLLRTEGELRANNERLREDAATWRGRYEAERKDHEATMKAWDEERSGL
jgi:predicted  nucleic acid-binding Zn-ribbon protein